MCTPCSCGLLLPFCLCWLLLLSHSLSQIRFFGKSKSDKQKGIHTTTDTHTYCTFRLCRIAAACFLFNSFLAPHHILWLPHKVDFLCVSEWVSVIHITMYTTPLPCPFINYLNKSHSTNTHSSYRGYSCVFCCLFHSLNFGLSCPCVRVKKILSYTSLLVQWCISTEDSFSACASMFAIWWRKKLME